MTLSKLREAIFPVTLLAFEAVGVKYWLVIFNNYTRWALLVILFLSVLRRGHVLLVFRTRSGFPAWCIFVLVHLHDCLVGNACSFPC